MAEEINRSKPLERVPSNIDNLDRILIGGFLRGGVYMIMGEPGAGKTILANQICFNHVAAGGRAVYMTLLAETHARMLAHIRPLAFFDPEPIGEALYYVSGYQVLEQEGLPGLLKLLRQMIRERRASLLVIDGLATAQALATSDLSYRRFLHELQVFVEAANCTAFLLTQPTSESGAYPEHTMVDGLITIHNRPVGARSIRELSVRKFRGSDFLSGSHIFEITGEGIQLYPRIEALLTGGPADEEERTRMAFGIPRLDEMLGGGLLSSSSTLLLGAPGSGKTMLGSHFLARGAHESQPGLYFGFYETPSRVVAKADAIGLNLSKAVQDGIVEMVWMPPLELVPDAVAERILDAVDRRGVKRLLIDGMEPLQDATHHPERIGPFFTALTNELRAKGVTTLATVELPDLFGPAVRVPVGKVSAITDNIIFLRYVELRSQLYRLISVMKVRESHYDPSIREFAIGPDGIKVSSTFQSAEAILTGVARPIERGPGSPPPLHDDEPAPAVDADTPVEEQS